jgi:prepilin-type N-terminal cleavage/methylation domain-containing protein
MITPFRVPSTRAGFTMIELMTVLVIAGILASVAAPAMNGYVQRQRESRVVNQITTDLSQARMMAIRAGEQASVARHSASTYSVGLVGSTTRRQVRLELDYPGVSLAFPGDGQVVFDSRGIVVAGTGVISVTMQDRTQELQVSVTGRAIHVRK